MSILLGLSIIALAITCLLLSYKCEHLENNIEIIKKHLTAVALLQIEEIKDRMKFAKSENVK